MLYEAVTCGVPFRSDNYNALMRAIVDNEPGVLARIAGLFSGRGYNIESLTVTETEHEANISRITIVTNGTDSIIQQIPFFIDLPFNAGDQ